ncbi:MAG: VWA domain-containing protein [Limnohabitans sp.]|jgi:archaellum component FlaC|nr:VWA domain-containing protein [Limnohabitans sp.]
MRRRHEHRAEGSELGWISMTDLMMLLFAVGILLAGGFALRASTSSAERVRLDHQLGIAQDELDRSRNQLQEWQLRSKDLEARIQRFDDLIGGAGMNPEDIQSSIESLRNELAIARGKVEASHNEILQRAAEVDAMRRGLTAVAGINGKLSATLQKERRNASKLQDQISGEGGLEELRRKLDQMSREREQREKERESEAVEKQRLASDIESMETKATELETALEGYEREVKAQKQIRQELLGIPGRLARVVMVVDRSQSMSEGDRWDDAKRTVTGWIEHLPVEAAALVVFGADVKVVPERFQPAKTAPVNSVDVPSIDAEIRVEMVEALGELSPAGLTPTAKALRQAMKFRDVDAIILFTDGAPEPDAGSVMDATSEVFDLVESWCRDNPNACVHTVGIGNYFERRMRDFLLGVAKRGRGTFIGR